MDSSPHSFLHSPPPHFLRSLFGKFHAVTLRIKGCVVSGQSGRRRDPRVRLEQPPFVRGITSAMEDEKDEGKRNISMVMATRLELAAIKNEQKMGDEKLAGLEAEATKGTRACARARSLE
ncbi:hypothetical protein V1478_017310 [Vespula squamosa]|uniref:Uncharacterized protein n=1 Tax=Vespula squamosa TaxID=30214 RepID=A0ABD1ZXL8_VESSQ